MKLVEKNFYKLTFIKTLIYQFPKFDFKIARINFTIICALKARKSIF